MDRIIQNLVQQQGALHYSLKGTGTRGKAGHPRVYLEGGGAAGCWRGSLLRYKEPLGMDQPHTHPVHGRRHTWEGVATTGRHPTVELIMHVGMQRWWCMHANCMAVMWALRPTGFAPLGGLGCVPTATQLSAWHIMPPLHVHAPCHVANHTSHRDRSRHLFPQLLLPTSGAARCWEHGEALSYPQRHEWGDALLRQAGRPLSCPVG